MTDQSIEVVDPSKVLLGTLEGEYQRGLLEGMKLQRERDAELGDKYADEVDQYHSTAGGFIRTFVNAIRSAMP